MKKINEKEIKEIFVGLKENEETSFNKLYEKYNRIVYGISFSILKNKEDSEDVMQTVFSKIYGLEREKLPNKNEASWIYSVTKNESISYLRKKNEKVELEKVYDIENEKNDIEDIIDKEKYNRIISKLNEKEKEIVSLKILSGLSFREIGKLINEPTNTVKWRYYKAIHTLKLLLGSLSLFVITFVIGIRNIFLEERNGKEQVKLEQGEKEQVKNEESNKIENPTNESGEKHRGDTNTENVEKTPSQNNTENVIGTITVTETNTKEEINYINIGIISVSAMLLVITIVLSIYYLKYQLKLHKK